MLLFEHLGCFVVLIYYMPVHYICIQYIVKTGSDSFTVKCSTSGANVMDPRMACVTVGVAR